MISALTMAKMPPGLIRQLLGRCQSGRSSLLAWYAQGTYTAVMAAVAIADIDNRPDRSTSPSPRPARGAAPRFRRPGRADSAETFPSTENPHALAGKSIRVRKSVRAKATTPPAGRGTNRRYGTFRAGAVRCRDNQLARA